jgi:hypothetical protein
MSDNRRGRASVIAVAGSIAVKNQSMLSRVMKQFG